MLALYYPGKGFITVSVTGTHCDLMCKHCNARFLRHMTPAFTPQTLYDTTLKAERDGCKGVLISGGSDSAGKVPIFDYLDIIKEIKKDTDLIINLHTGFIAAEDVKRLENLGIDVISFDVVGSKEAVKNVFGLELPDDYFDDVLAAFSESGLNVVPHITAGLDGGKDSGEETALKIIARHPPKLVIINSLIPLPGLDPEGNRLLHVLELASKILPAGTKIGIGCMRPRNIDIPLEILDKFEIGTIAMPSRELRKKLDESGIEYLVKNGCCALEAVGH